MRAAARLGYQPVRRVEQPLPASASTIAFVCDEISTDPWTAIGLDGVREKAWEHGLTVTVMVTRGDTDMEAAALAQLAREPLVGLVYATINTRLIEAPREKLWRCWTEPKLMVQWFTPPPWKTVHAETDVRPGGASYIVMKGPEGQEMPNRGVYLGVVKNERLVFTDAYTRATLLGVPEMVERELAKIRGAAALAVARGFRLYAGHGLTVANVGPIAALPGMEELNIGHFLVSRAVMVGMAEAVREMLGAMGGGKG